MFRKLRIRLTVVCAVVTSLVLVVMASASFCFSAKQLREQRRSHFESSVGSICYVVSTQPAISHAWILETEAAEGMWVDIRSRDYVVCVEADKEKRNQLAEAAIEYAGGKGFDALLHPAKSLSPETMAFILYTQTGRFRAAVSSIATERGVLCVTVLEDMAGERGQIILLLLQYAVCVVAAAFCLLGFSWVFTGKAVRPVETSRKRQTEFISAASHELRSPLAVVQVSAEKVQNAATPDAARKYGEIIARECTRLSRLTGDLLSLAGADNENWSMRTEPAYPDAILLNAAESYEQVAVQKGIKLEVALPAQPLPGIVCDSQRMEQALAVLLDNALRFTPPQGRVRVAVLRKGHQVSFSVSDSGPGVPDELKEKVFERFFQENLSRTDREHFGLGLSIAVEIARLHRGRLQVRDSPLGGAEFLLSVPIIRPGSPGKSPGN